MDTIEKRFIKYSEILTSRRFLDMEGLGGEVPFFIIHHQPEEQNKIDALVDGLIKKIQNEGISLLELNLYDLCLEILKARGALDKFIEMEPRWSHEQKLKHLQAAVDINSQLIPLIKKKVGEVNFQMVLVTGVGLVYPYIRSHSILNCLQSIVKSCPLVMFFPGEYSHNPNVGSALNLFGRLMDDRYYRAADLDLYEI